MTELVLMGVLAHFVGDYLTQSDWMANEKLKRMWPAVVHGTVYSIPFVFIAPSFWSWFVIWSTHIVIDRYRLARYVVFAKNYLAPQNHWPVWDRCKATGYDQDRPPFVAVWLMIIADNTIHVIINTLAIVYL